jgi:hypothetical protein
MTPFVVSSQVNDHVTDTLKSEGFRIGSDMVLRKRDKPYMNATLFAEYLSTVFLPHIAKIRSDPRFTDKEAVLLMDNWTAPRSAPWLANLCPAKSYLTWPKR